MNPTYQGGSPLTVPMPESADRRVNINERIHQQVTSIMDQCDVIEGFFRRVRGDAGAVATQIRGERTKSPTPTLVNTTEMLEQVVERLRVLCQELHNIA